MTTPTPELTKLLPTDAKRWIGIAVAASMVLGTLTGSIVTVIGSVNGSAKSAEIQKVQESVDALAKSHTETLKRLEAHERNIELAADLAAQLNGGPPGPRWPHDFITWEPPPRDGTRTPTHKTAAAWVVTTPMR